LQLVAAIITLRWEMFMMIMMMAMMVMLTPGADPEY